MGGSGGGIGESQPLSTENIFVPLSMAAQSLRHAESLGRFAQQSPTERLYPDKTRAEKEIGTAKQLSELSSNIERLEKLTKSNNVKKVLIGLGALLITAAAVVVSIMATPLALLALIPLAVACRLVTKASFKEEATLRKVTEQVLTKKLDEIKDVACEQEDLIRGLKEDYKALHHTKQYLEFESQMNAIDSKLNSLDLILYSIDKPNLDGLVKAGQESAELTAVIDAVRKQIDQEQGPERAGLRSATDQQKKEVKSLGTEIDKLLGEEPSLELNNLKALLDSKLSVITEYLEGNGPEKGEPGYCDLPKAQAASNELELIIKKMKEPGFLIGKKRAGKRDARKLDKELDQITHIKEAIAPLAEKLDSLEARKEKLWPITQFIPKPVQDASKIAKWESRAFSSNSTADPALLNAAKEKAEKAIASLETTIIEGERALHAGAILEKSVPKQGREGELDALASKISAITQKEEGKTDLTKANNALKAAREQYDIVRAHLRDPNFKDKPESVKKAEAARDAVNENISKAKAAISAAEKDFVQLKKDLSQLKKTANQQGKKLKELQSKLEASSSQGTRVTNAWGSRNALETANEQFQTDLDAKEVNLPELLKTQEKLGGKISGFEREVNEILEEDVSDKDVVSEAGEKVAPKRARVEQFPRFSSFYGDKALGTGFKVIDEEDEKDEEGGFPISSGRRSFDGGTLGSIDDSNNGRLIHSASCVGSALMAGLSEVPEDIG